jgi:hypothetical protein
VWCIDMEKWPNMLAWKQWLSDTRPGKRPTMPAPSCSA